jgi:predicted HicB family RNase H-like nuclease
MPKGPKLKTATMTLRLEPELKAAAKIAARAQRRSVANFIEVLIVTHCESHKIDTGSQKASRGVR